MNLFCELLTVRRFHVCRLARLIDKWSRGTLGSVLGSASSCLTKTPPQEQLETISSSTLVWGTFLLSFKGGVYKSKRSQWNWESPSFRLPFFANAISADVVLVVHSEMSQLKPWEDILSCCSQIASFYFIFFYERRYARGHLQIQIFYGRTIYFRGGGWKNKKSLIWKAFVQETLQKLCRKKKVKNGS